MPRVQRRDLPLALLNHLLDRISERAISADQLEEFADWLDTEPEVPDGRWFKRFPRNDCLRRGLVGQDLPAGRAGSHWRRNELSGYEVAGRFGEPLTALKA